MRINTVKEPKYQNIKRFIMDGIRDGLYKPGDKLPSESELIDRFETSHITVRRAMTDLVSEGIVYRIQGKGSFVMPLAEDESEIVVSHLLFENDRQDSSLIGLLRGAGEYMSQKGIRIRYDFLDTSVESECLYMERLINERIRGALLYLHDPDQCVEKLREMDEAGLPYVLMDRCPRSYQVNYVASNNITGGYMQVQYLVALGHHKIGFVYSDLTLNTERERQAGYLEGISELCPGETARLIPCDEHFENEIMRLLNAGAITALVSVNDLTAIRILRRLEEKGVTVPGDLSLVGFDDWEPIRYIKPAITTVRQDFNLLGHQGAKLLCEAMQTKSLRGKVVLLPVQMVERDSTAPLKS